MLTLLILIFVIIASTEYVNYLWFKTSITTIYSTTLLLKCFFWQRKCWNCSKSVNALWALKLTRCWKIWYSSAQSTLGVHPIWFITPFEILLLLKCFKHKQFIVWSKKHLLFCWNYVILLRMATDSFENNLYNERTCQNKFWNTR